MTRRPAVEVAPAAGPRGPAVLLRVHGVDAALLSPLEVGRLRAALRDAVIDAGELANQPGTREERRRA